MGSDIKEYNSDQSEEAISSVLYSYFETAVTNVFNSRESKLFEFYNQLATLTQNFWYEFDTNIAFVRKFDSLNYDYDKIEPADLNWKLSDSTSEQLNEIKTNF